MAAPEPLLRRRLAWLAVICIASVLTLAVIAFAIRALLL